MSILANELNVWLRKSQVTITGYKFSSHSEREETMTLLNLYYVTSLSSKGLELYRGTL